MTQTVSDDQSGSSIDQHTLARATFSKNAKQYYVANAVIGSGLIFGIFGLFLVPIMFGLSLLLWSVPVVMWFCADWYYTRYFQKLRCELGPRKLEVARGLWFREERAIPLDKITDLGVKQGPIMRWLRLEALSVETAGQSGGSTSGALVTLVGIEESRRFRAKVIEQRDRVVGSAEVPLPLSTPPAVSPPVSPMAAGSVGDALDGTPAILADIRDTLHRIERRLDDRA
ncbi:MAG: PH domain-containing protein [Planctomycetota bacterium]